MAATNDDATKPNGSLNRTQSDLREEVLDLARRLTSASISTPETLFPVPTSGSLDPHDPAFDARKWTKAFYSTRKAASNGAPPRTTGIAFKDVDIYGFGSDTDFQKSVGNVFLEMGRMVRNLYAKPNRVDILRGLEGILEPGELLAVLGPPGSGCSTFLKAIAGETHGFHISKNSYINYQGIHPMDMNTVFRGEAIYTAETDYHFPSLSVGDTLYFAARARCPRKIPGGISADEYCKYLRDVTMAVFGISHTRDTRVGDDFIRGVSGGERKRTTIAEAALSYAPFQCWDNSTRGLDSANALEFCRCLRTQADIMGHTSAVAIYQASQDAYDLFDKVLVLYQGRQIFFGRAGEAKEYFEGLGFVCPDQQTTADFLTSMTSHQERIIRPGWENQTPRSPDEFSEAWKKSVQRLRLMEDLEKYQQQYPFGGKTYDDFAQSRRADQSKFLRKRSPFTLSYFRQIALTLERSWVLLKNDPSVLITMLLTNFIEALIVGSIFYNLSQASESIFKRCLLIFFISLTNAFGSILEILSLYSKRKIIEKHARYALYHPSAEALSAILIDLPYKILNAILVNTTIYFMGNLRREPGPFFFFLLINFSMTQSMSMIFRVIGSSTKTVAQALAPASILLLDLSLYAGFAIPPQYMLDWIGWSRWLNPVYYGFESMALNELDGRDFSCSAYVPRGPEYESVDPMEKACSIQGSVPGLDFVRGSDYLLSSFGFVSSHKWRNFGLILALIFAFLGLHVLSADYIASERSKGEVLVFIRKAILPLSKKHSADEESPSCRDEKADEGAEVPSTEDHGVERQTSIFHWKDVCFDVKTKGGPLRILDHVDGWVKPGTLTALMGASGAGKTTLLDILASRVTTGVVSGEMLVDGMLRDKSFQRKTGYVQQQDLHLHTSTVREALTFSAILRQPDHFSTQQKVAYVDTVIDILEMRDYSDAIIGVQGEGLNVEQRKRLTIGVELAARPQLLLFLDEPTSGLDSQTSWSICSLMEKLARNGQAILCTIHQPSAILFQRFDRLLLLAQGKTIYFGEIGRNSQTLLDYLERTSSVKCPAKANPAEYMLNIIGAAPGGHADVDWSAAWRASPEYHQVREELARLATAGARHPSIEQTSAELSSSSEYDEFAAPFWDQLLQVTKRVFQQYWRSPSYIYAKAVMSIGTALFLGLSFINADNTERGLQNQMFGVFMFLNITPSLVDQIIPVFVSQRTMYEARERPSKAYSWKAFMVANILVELAWNSLIAVVCFLCWYYPIGLYRNAFPTDSVDSRGIAVLLQVWVFFVFTSTFSNMMIAGIETAEVASSISNLLAIVMFAFCGVLARPEELPGFWIFMYRVNPFTYVVEGFLGTSLANAEVQCAHNEFITFQAPNDTTCGAYMAPYISDVGGYLFNPDTGGRGEECQFCTMSDTNTFLSPMDIDFNHRWRNFGIMWGYCIFNIIAAFVLYWLFRVPRIGKIKKE